MADPRDPSRGPILWTSSSDRGFAGFPWVAVKELNFSDGTIWGKTYHLLFYIPAMAT